MRTHRSIATSLAEVDLSFTRRSEAVRAGLSE